MIPVDLILPIAMTMALAGFALIARIYVLPATQSLDLRDALVPLILPHCFRYLGLSFLIAGVTAQPLDTRFSIPAAYGDLIAALLAFLAIIALRRRWRLAVPLTLLFNIWGLGDLLNAVARGILYVPPSHMGAPYFIPMIIVPFLIATHVLIFIVIVRARRQVRAT